MKNCKYNCLIGLSIIFILAAPFLFARSGLACFNFLGTGPIGDTIGGITAPFIGILSILLLYNTLKAQQAFNADQQTFNTAQQAFNVPGREEKRSLVKMIA